jgi:hypothetical protein
MRQRLYHRLHQLEAESARVRLIRNAKELEADLARARRGVERFLRICGVEQTNTESLMDAWARALNISPRELRAQLQAGIDPIKKHFTETGIYAEIERRKAAGTWPSG